MIKLKNKSFIVRKAVAIAIIIHGLYNVATVTSYIDSVVAMFSGIIDNYSVLIVTATILPFAEFLTGALLFMKVGVKRSAVLATFISLIMVVLIVVGQLNFLKLAYHLIIIIALTYIYVAYSPIILNESNYNLTKHKRSS